MPIHREAVEAFRRGRSNGRSCRGLKERFGARVLEPPPSVRFLELHTMQAGWATRFIMILGGGDAERNDAPVYHSKISMTRALVLWDKAVDHAGEAGT